LRLQAEEYLVADDECVLSHVLIRLVLHPLLHPQQVQPNRINDQGAFTKPSVDVSWSDGTGGCDT
jgi:hypothetical protein